MTLRCKARGDPDPIIHWIAPDGRLMSNSSRAAVHTDGTLDILISTVKDSGPLTLHLIPPLTVRQHQLFLHARYECLAVCPRYPVHVWALKAPCGVNFTHHLIYFSSVSAHI